MTPAAKVPAAGQSSGGPRSSRRSAIGAVQTGNYSDQVRQAAAPPFPAGAVAAGVADLVTALECDERGQLRRHAAALGCHADAHRCLCMSAELDGEGGNRLDFWNHEIGVICEALCLCPPGFCFRTVGVTRCRGPRVVAPSPLQSSDAALPRGQSSRARRRIPTLATGRRREPPGSNRHRPADERIRRKHTCATSGGCRVPRPRWRTSACRWFRASAASRRDDESERRRRRGWRSDAWRSDGAKPDGRAIQTSPLRSRRGHVSWRFLSRKALVRSRRLSRLPLGDRDQCRQFVGRRFRASTITACVGTDGTDGRPRPRSPGCRLARGSGHLIAAGTRAAPTRPFGKRDRASCRSSVGGRRLCRAHNSAITGSHDYTADPTTATVANQRSTDALQKQ